MTAKAGYRGGPERGDPGGRKRAGWVAGGILVLVLFVFVTAQAVTRAGRADGNDFTSYLLASRTLYQGDSPYQTHSPFPYIYPLLLAFGLAPLTWLPVQVAALVWTLLLGAALFGSVWLMRQSNGGRAVSVAVWIALCILLFDVIQNNLVNGQVNLLVLFTCLSAWEALRKQHGGRAALLAGGAVALKIFPLVLILPMLVRGRWRLAIGTVAVALILCVLPGIIPGFELARTNGEYVRGFLGGHLRGMPGDLSSVDFTVVGWLRRCGLGVGPLAPILAGGTLGILLLAWDVVNCRRFGREFTAGAFALYMLLPLFVVPLPQVHHLIMALPALGVQLTGSTAPRSWTRYILLTAAIAVYLLASLLWREGPLYLISLALLVAGVLRTTTTRVRTETHPGLGAVAERSGDG